MNADGVLLSSTNYYTRYRHVLRNCMGGIDDHDECEPEYATNVDGRVAASFVGCSRHEPPHGRCGSLLPRSYFAMHCAEALALSRSTPKMRRAPAALRGS